MVLCARQCHTWQPLAQPNQSKARGAHLCTYLQLRDHVHHWLHLPWFNVSIQRLHWNRADPAANYLRIPRGAVDVSRKIIYLATTDTLLQAALGPRLDCQYGHSLCGCLRPHLLHFSCCDARDGHEHELCKCRNWCYGVVCSIELVFACAKALPWATIGCSRLSSTAIVSLPSLACFTLLEHWIFLADIASTSFLCLPIISRGSVWRLVCFETSCKRRSYAFVRRGRYVDLSSLLLRQPRNMATQLRVPQAYLAGSEKRAQSVVQ